jgi:metal-responsive CopG/Arc/MetJ family transcriptional regulator
MGKRRITVDLDERLLTAVDEAAAECNRSRNQFLTEAVERTLKEIERERIDAAFMQMANDSEYQLELLRIEQEMSPASDEAWAHLDRAESRRSGRS